MSRRFQRTLIAACTLFIATACFQNRVHAQEAAPTTQLSDTHNELDKPVQLVANAQTFNYHFKIKPDVRAGMMRGKRRYSEEEMKRLDELVYGANYPTALSGSGMRKYSKLFPFYKCYEVVKFIGGETLSGLIWIPKKGNEHMPDFMQPTTDEGMYVAVDWSYYSKKDINLSGTKPPQDLLDLLAK